MENLDYLSAKALYDYELVKQALDGQQKAYSELLKRYYDSVYFMLVKMVKNNDDADDLIMEAFAKAFKGLRNYTPDFAFSTWLFRIATNNGIDYLRKNKNKTLSLDTTYETEEGNGLTLDIKSTYLDPEERIISEQKSQIIRDMVNNLKPRYRRLIELRFFNEMSYEEICNELNLPLGTVKGQLFRAKEMLLAILKNTRDTI
jgi:RNA polymerase sigma factor (sigma-70 family)